MKNLDAIINEVGFEIVESIKNKDKERTKYKNYIDKSLGVLANDGVYAYWVYCKANKIDDIFIKKIEKLKEFVNIENADDEEFFRNLSNDIHQLLFFKEILEKVLIYARYHAKALKVSENE
ncbi:hypothetical protein [Caminibacter mediatlanticus]|uniref:CRISPR type III-B/RAMP module-associated protein Cmr5 n=1 Tax=Caminibacter mediatlanticus TB-2 TaxID=391592 RepID=A0AAI9F2Z3_9BACT|nr:hypothetical protein [Caminibacter mediatlanticus]EDM24319.1 hypothetical protein CMTB2_02348 [Caminibacter mediatlanticus TB-2]